jgi:hypothetical protein
MVSAVVGGWRMRLGWALVAAVAAGCATTRAQDPLRGRCESNLAADPECVAVLTRPDAGYEAEQEVAAAEEARQVNAFQGRLARMRAEHEAREATRTSTVAAAPSDPEALEDEVALTLALAEEAPVDTGSSLRALEAAPPPPPPPQVVVPTRAPPPAAEEAPTPEVLLRAGRCLIQEDRALASGLLTELKKRPGSSRAEQGALALVLMDGQALMDRVDAELVHRGLAKAGPVCSSSQLAAAGRQLRAVLGAAPAQGADASRYGAGLERLTEALQTRAGLPRGQ